MFGVITCAGGSVGVIGGSLAATRLRSFTADSDPLVCAFSMLAAAPFVYAGLILPSHNLPATWVGLVYSRFITTTTCISVYLSHCFILGLGICWPVPACSATASCCAKK